MRKTLSILGVGGLVLGISTVSGNDLETLLGDLTFGEVPPSSLPKESGENTSVVGPPIQSTPLVDTAQRDYPIMPLTSRTRAEPASSSQPILDVPQLIEEEPVDVTTQPKTQSLPVPEYVKQDIVAPVVQQPALVEQKVTEPDATEPVAAPLVQEQTPPVQEPASFVQQQAPLVQEQAKEAPEAAVLELPEPAVDPQPIAPPVTESTHGPLVHDAQMLPSTPIPVVFRGGHCQTGCDQDYVCQPHEVPQLPNSTLLQYFRSNKCNTHVWDGYRQKCPSSQKHLMGTCDCFDKKKKAGCDKCDR